VKRLHCLRHDLYLDYDPARRRRALRVVLDARPGFPDMEHCALLWHEDPRPGVLSAWRRVQRRKVGPCEVEEVR